MAEITNNIAKVRKQRGLSQQQLADKVGAHVITISNLERGRAPLTSEWMERLSIALRVDESLLLKMERPLRVFVGAELTANRLIFWEAEDIENSENMQFSVAIAETPGNFSADSHRWAVLRDASLYPVFQELDVVRVVPVLENNEDEFEWAKQRLCIVMPRGKEEIYVGYLSRESVEGHLKVNRIVGPPIDVDGPSIIFVIDRAIYQPVFRED
jgi:transcriptional regulator with XRE-family HTH domain